MSVKPIIAVGVDESDSSRRALEWAAHEALRRGAGLRVITAWSWETTDSAPLAAANPQAVLELAEEIQSRAVTSVLGRMEVKPPTTCEVVQGTAAEALVNASRDCDLVVVGTHGRGPVRTFLLGSVSLSVIKKACCPVVVMPPAGQHAPPTDDLATTAGHPL